MLGFNRRKLERNSHVNCEESLMLLMLRAPDVQESWRLAAGFPDRQSMSKQPSKRKVIHYCTLSPFFTVLVVNLLMAFLAASPRRR